MSNPVIVYAVDIGSEGKGRLAWCRLPASLESANHTSLESLADSLQVDLEAGGTVAIGFECPLVIELGRAPGKLTSARQGEGNRAWCAGAGSGALAVGLAQCAWLFERLARPAHMIRPTFSWADLASGQANLLVWEAFVSNKQGERTHLEDALRAAHAFQEGIAHGEAPHSLVEFQLPYSLAGAALLRAGLSTDIDLLRQPCIVVRG